MIRSANYLKLQFGTCLQECSIDAVCVQVPAQVRPDSRPDSKRYWVYLFFEHAGKRARMRTFEWMENVMLDDVASSQYTGRGCYGTQVILLYRSRI